jgi:hypothetical protein
MIGQKRKYSETAATIENHLPINQSMTFKCNISDDLCQIDHPEGLDYHRKRNLKANMKNMFRISDEKISHISPNNER